MALPQYLIDQGYEEAPDNVSDRDASRRTSNINGYNVYFLDSQETARDAKEKAWADAAPTRAWAKLRAERDNKIAKTDWMALGDTTSIPTAWKTYRQELRDLPSKYNDTTVQGTITWPEEPS